MAESKKRKKNGHEVEDDTDIQNWTDGIPLSPAWWAPTFVALMILGLLWVVVYYISSGTYPVPKLGAWNIAVGLGTMMVGFRRRCVGADGGAAGAGLPSPVSVSVGRSGRGRDAPLFLSTRPWLTTGSRPRPRVRAC